MIQVTRLQEDAVRSASSKYFAEIDLRPNCDCAVQCSVVYTQRTNNAVYFREIQIQE